MRLVRLVSGLLAIVLLAQTPGTVTVGVTVSAAGGKMACVISNPAPPKVRIECSESGVKKLTQDVTDGSGVWSNGADTVNWSVSGSAWSVTANGVTKSGNF